MTFSNHPMLQNQNYQIRKRWYRLWNRANTINIGPSPLHRRKTVRLQKMLQVLLWWWGLEFVTRRIQTNRKRKRLQMICYHRVNAMMVTVSPMEVIKCINRIIQSSNHWMIYWLHSTPRHIKWRCGRMASDLIRCFNYTRRGCMVLASSSCAMSIALISYQTLEPDI